jgi:hypothetical protein
MQCANHPDKTATAYCSNCGVAICPNCLVKNGLQTVCSKCSRDLDSQPNPSSVPPSEEPASRVESPRQDRDFVIPPIPLSERGYPYCPPGVCLALGLIPGVGAIANGDYFKAFLQVLIFGSLVSLANSPEVGEFSAMFSVLAAAFYVYMLLGAYHTSKKRRNFVRCFRRNFPS